MKFQNQTPVSWIARLMVVAVAAGSVLGCGAPDNEAIAVAEQALGEGSCATVPATFTATNLIKVAYPWPGYTTAGCGKAHIIDVAPYKGITTAVSWNDSLPSTQAECEALWIASFVYQRVGNTWGNRLFKDGYGTWQGSACTGPAIFFNSAEMDVGTNGHRVVVSARTAATSAASTRGYLVRSEGIR